MQKIFPMKKKDVVIFHSFLNVSFHLVHAALNDALLSIGYLERLLNKKGER